MRRSAEQEEQRAATCSNVQQNSIFIYVRMKPEGELDLAAPW
jgi:hypothetical protein